MTTTTLTTCLGLLAACLTASTAAVADDNCTGYVVQVGDKAVSMTHARDDTSTPAIGTCRAAVPGSGTCTYTDRDNDTYTNEWRLVPGTTNRYQWETVSGTGKWADARWSGWSLRIMRDGDVRVSQWGGDCTKTAVK
jgi:hypothetical protein